jgi:DNA-binding transcriptional ArsR family regulator
VSARAETIRILMGTRTWLTTAEIASLIDYTKRNVADALESLRLSGLVDVQRQGNTIRHRLNRYELRSVIAPLPKLFPLWKPLLQVVSALLNLGARQDALNKSVRSVEARQAVDSVAAQIATAGLREPDLSVIGEDFWDSSMSWGIEVVTGLAFGEVARAFRNDREPFY